jgi:hypothetical protein
MVVLPLPGGCLHRYHAKDDFSRVKTGAHDFIGPFVLGNLHRPHRVPAYSQSLDKG